MKTFYGGIHPPQSKNRTSGIQIREAKAPGKVVIPLSQHTGSPCESVVAVGDEVKTGSLIGKATGFISSPIHSSISGKVKRIAAMPHPVFSKAMAVVIENEGIAETHAFSPRSDGEAVG